MSRRLLLRFFALTPIFLCAVADATAYEIVKGPAPIVDSRLQWSAYRRFSSADGLPGATVNALTQDKDGFVYAGTENGLAQFDGNAWHKIVLPPNNASSVILKLVALDDGSVWIGTDNDGLFRYAHGSVTAQALPPGATEKDMEALAAAGKNAAYVGTSRSLYRCELHACTEIKAGHGLEVAALLVGTFNDRRCLWVGTNEDGLYRIDAIDDAEPARSEWHLSGKELGSPAVRALAQWGGNDGKDLWVGSGLSLVRFSHERIVSYAAYKNERSNGVLSLLPGRNQDGNEVLHVGLSRGGIADINLDGTWSVQNRTNGLPEDYVTTLFQTDTDLRTPVLWIGMQNAGIARRDAAVWSSFDERDGLPNHIIHGMGELTFPDDVRTQWIGTADGFVRWRNHRWEPWFRGAHEHAIVNAAARMGDDIWLGTDFGLIDIRPDGSEAPPLDETALHGTIVEALHHEEDKADQPGAMWIGTHYGFARAVGRTLTSVDVPALSGEQSAFAFTETTDANHKRTLWVGGNGVGYRQDDVWHAMPDSCGLPPLEIFDLKEHGSPSHGHALWVAHRYGATRIDLDNGLQCESVPSSVMSPEPFLRVVFDASDRLYLFGKLGVVRLTPDAMAPNDLSQFRMERFGLDDGLPTLEFNRGAMVDEQGRIWAASVEGAVLYDPREEAAPHPPRPFRLLSARVDGTQKPLTDDEILDADDNNLAFDFSLLSFQRDRLTRYRTELTGLDEPLTEWTPEDRRVFRRLPAGDYAFHAYARDGFGVEAEPLSMRFSIMSPLWRRWWAIVLYVLAAVALSATISRRRIERLRRASKVLEQTVKDRTASLTDANVQLEDARKIAEAATQSKSVFLANMSHEIRTPMNAVLGFAGLGLRLDVPPKAHDYFRKINSAGQNLLNVLNDILDFSKIEAGKMALETVPFALSDVLAHVTDLFTLKASEKSLEFVVGTAPGVPDQFVGDPLRLGQVLLNLVNNAIKFTQAGFVQLYVEQVENAGRNGKMILRFSVEDSGIGMSNDQMARLFQPFSQADHSTTRNFGGTGLGLTISQRLVAQMGGLISVSSHRGAGSSFRFEIALKRQEHASAQRRHIPEKLAGLKILVVDDSPQAREWLCDPLTSLRFDVATADSGEAALERLHREKFDLIMMDWMMPGIDGIETTRRIRSDIALERIPQVIMVTAHGREAIQDAAESVGVLRFLIKPVNPSLLFDTIVETLDAEPSPAPARKSQTAPMVSPNFQSIRVLLSEDNQINQALAIDMLASAGLQVDIANNGIEALKMAQTSSYAAILMDIEMPEMDGYTAAREIRDRMGDSAPPIIAMTAHASHDHRQRCLGAGMMDFITKPILYDELLATLKKWIPNMTAPDTAKTMHQSAPASTEIDVPSALARMNGNTSLFKKLLVMFTDVHAHSDGELRTALSNGDTKAARRIAHSAAGAAGNISAMRLHDAGQQLEETIARGDAAKIEILLIQFSTALNATIASCKEVAARF